jgi:hypothetical protein
MRSTFFASQLTTRFFFLRSNKGRECGEEWVAMRKAVVLAILLVLLPVAAQDPSAVDSPLPAASIVDGWGRGAGIGRGARAPHSHSPILTWGDLERERGSSDSRDPTMPPALDSIWEGHKAPSQRTINSQVEQVLQKSVTAVKNGPREEPSAKATSVRGRQGSPAHLPPVPGSKFSNVGTEEKTTDATTYIDYKNGRIYLSEKPMAQKPVPVRQTHAQKMMSMAHANMDSIAKKDKLFADQLRKEAKELAAAGMAAEGTVRPLRTLPLCFTSADPVTVVL